MVEAQRCREAADESRRYLTEKLGSDKSRLDGAEELAAELGHLPLALAQAAAVILDLRLDCRGYLTRFRARSVRSGSAAGAADRSRRASAATSRAWPSRICLPPR